MDSKVTGKSRGLSRLRIACLFHSRIPTRERRAPVLIQNFGPHLKSPRLFPVTIYRGTVTEIGARSASVSGHLREHYECRVASFPEVSLARTLQTPLLCVRGPSVSARFEGAPTIGVTTTNGALCLLKTSFGSPDSLLETTEQILMSACAAEPSTALAPTTEDQAF